MQLHLSNQLKQQQQQQTNNNKKKQANKNRRNIIMQNPVWLEMYTHVCV